MIKITKKVEYSLIALKHISQKNDGQVSTAKEIASLYKIPRELLAKILQKLTRDGYISSVQGPKGGYEISRPTKNVNLNELIKTVEGSAGFIDCVSGDDKKCERFVDCPISSSMLQINKHLNKFFDKISLEDIFNNKISV